MSLSLQQYKDILTIAFDHQLAQLKGGIVFDDFDPAVEGDKILRARVARLVKQKKIDKLEKMLQTLIERFRFKDEYNFASVLYEKTGYNIEPISAQHISVSANRNISVQMSGIGDNSLTVVVIELPTGSGSIYCIKGSCRELKADWLDEHTIEVQIPAIREETQRVSQVSTYGETIKILYKE
jgi:hypothetical protein